MGKTTMGMMGGLLGCAIVLGGASTARAHEPFYLTLNGGVAGPINDPATDLWGVGGEAALGVYYSLINEVAIGTRLRAGALHDAGSIPQILPEDDPGLLDYGYFGGTVRLRPFGHLMDVDRRGAGFYLDIGGGGGLVDGEIVPALETAVGWNFGIGPVSLGPNVRYTQFFETTEERFAGNDVMMWTANLEMTFFDQVPVQRVVETPRVAVPPPRVAVDNDRDDDGYLNANDRCPDQPEVWNGYEDEDGCSDEGVGQFVNDALVVDERVFFDYDSDELRPAGQAQLDVVARHYQENRERYDHLIVTGHSDIRGTVEHNVGLSERRANVVMTYLKDHGVPVEAMEIVAAGESEPVYPEAQTEYEHQVNRRVEFRPEWRVGMVPEGIAPERNPTEPDYVDPAPPAVIAREERLARREERRREREAARAERRGTQPSEPTASAEEIEPTTR